MTENTLTDNTVHTNIDVCRTVLNKHPQRLFYLQVYAYIQIVIKQ